MSWTTKALIDTGAPYTLFDRATGEALGVEFDRPSNRARRVWHRIAGGDYLAQIEIVVLRLQPFPDLWWETEVGFFLDDWGMPFGGLLGQEGFLDRWVASFNRYDNYFIIEEPDSFKERLPIDESSIFEGRDLGWKGGP